MSIRHIKAVRRYYVVSTGYAESDFIESGEMSADGTIPMDTEWPEEATITWSKTRETQLEHPAFVNRDKTIQETVSSIEIDKLSAVDISSTHAGKAVEARLVKFQGVTDTAQLPYIAAEIDRQPGKTMLEIADEIWTEYTGVAASEATRTHERRTRVWTRPSRRNH